MFLAADEQSAGATAWLAVLICVAVALAVLFVAALLSVLRAPLPPSARIAWVLGVFVFPLLGPVVWFTVGRRATPSVAARR